MSGLVGWVDVERDLRSEEGTLAAMTETMRRRGPGRSGTWLSQHAVLGHRAATVVADSGAAQPIVDASRGAPVALVFDGRIYNAPDLRRRIGAHAEASAISEGELILRAYLTWGLSFIEHLEGMFAFAIWDERSRQLLLGRDRMGNKPLHYATLGRGLLFASEPKGIMAHPRFAARLDIDALPILLQPRLTRPGETPLVGLHEVPPATLAVFRGGAVELRRYWRLVSAPHEGTFEETARHVRSLLEGAVVRQLTQEPTSGPVGAMLSGGLDSTSVVALAMGEFQRSGSGKVVDTSCIAFEAHDGRFLPTDLRPDIDTPYAAAAARFLGTRHETITATARDVLEAIPDTRSLRDLPGWGQFDASMYILFRAMKQRGSVALTGEIADEIFGGYPYFFDPRLIARDGFPWLDDGPRLATYLIPELSARFDPAEDEQRRYSELLADVPRLAGEDPVNARMREVTYVGLFGRLSVLLDRMDRMSMGLGLEVRFPFCDHHLIEYVWNVPWSMKASGGVKGLLKAAMADIMPPETLARRKNAYPHIQDPAYDEALIREATDIVRQRRSPFAQMFDAPRLSELISQLSRPDAGVNATHLLIQLVEVERWIEAYHVSVG